MIPYAQLFHLAMPEVIVVVTALVVLALDVVAFRSRGLRQRFLVATSLGSVGCAAAILILLRTKPVGDTLSGIFVSNPLTHWLQVALLALTILVFLLSANETFTDHVGEFVLLVMLATTGMMFLVATQDLLVVFLSLELLSLSLYALTAFHKSSLKSAEGGLKYFLFGGMSAAFLLFGFSLLYGFANSTSFSTIAAVVQSSPHHPLLIVAMVMTMIGFGFKVAAVPFHFWAPDVYEAAPMPVAAFIASSSKVASFYVFFELMAFAFAGATGRAAFLHFSQGWVPVLASIAAVSMMLGNFVAIRQRGLRRLMAYSAIAHAGYMLLGIVSHTEASLAALLYYVVTYSLATLGVFAVIGVVEQDGGDDRMASFNGLSQRAPVASGCLFLCVLSLAGIPPLAGFFGKFYLFITTLAATPRSTDLLWLVVLALAMSAVSLFYYLQVLKRAFVLPPNAGATDLQTPVLTKIVMMAIAVSLLGLGCVPEVALRRIVQSIASSH